MSTENNNQQETSYEVRRYFDDHFEKVVGKNLTRQEAKELANKLNEQPRAYVNHSVHESLNPTP